MDVDELRRRLRRSRRGRRGRYPAELREAALTHAMKAKGKGKTDAQVAAELGMSLATLQYWRAAGRRGQLIPVSIGAEPSPATDLVVECGPVRVRGLGIDGVAELLRRLG